MAKNRKSQPLRAPSIKPLKRPKRPASNDQALQLAEFKELRSAVIALASKRPRNAPRNTQPEQPFDSVLMSISRLYRRSRELYLSMGGEFRPLFVSSQRTLSSPTLLDPLIQYTPIEAEMVWAATDAVERKNPSHLLQLRTFVGSLFHEQNHRILWNFLPPPPADASGIRRYLNFAESLIISTDMALADQLERRISRQLYVSGTIYGNGSDSIRKLKLNRRELRNYLQATTHATYLVLEHYCPEVVDRAVAALFPNLGELSHYASERSARLDFNFIWLTNPEWQKRHWKKVERTLSSRKRRGEEILELPDNPMDNRVQYLLAEKWFEAMGL